MNIIERTQYSADGGETWADTENEVICFAVQEALNAYLSARASSEVARLIEDYPDALIQALRDMGALPFDPVHAAQHGYQDGYRDALKFSADNGSLQSCGVTYAVIPAEQHAKEEAALAKIKDWARHGSVHSTCKAARDWCDKHDINVNEYK